MSVPRHVADYLNGLAIKKNTDPCKPSERCGTNAKLAVMDGAHVSMEVYSLDFNACDPRVLELDCLLASLERRSVNVASKMPP